MLEDQVPSAGRKRERTANHLSFPRSLHANIGKHAVTSMFGLLKHLIEALLRGKIPSQRTGTISRQIQTVMITKIDLVILDALGYLPLSASGGALLCQLLRKLCKRTSVFITTNLNFSEWAQVFSDIKMTTVLLDRLTHRCHILATGNNSYRFKASSEAEKTRKKAAKLTNTERPRHKQ